LARHLQTDAETDQDLAYYFDADADPAYHFDADADPDPIFQFDTDPCGSDPQHWTAVSVFHFAVLTSESPAFLV
jgi:hypothetical protein